MQPPEESDHGSPQRSMASFPKRSSSPTTSTTVPPNYIKPHSENPTTTPHPPPPVYKERAPRTDFAVIGFSNRQSSLEVLVESLKEFDREKERLARREAGQGIASFLQNVCELDVRCIPGADWQNALARQAREKEAQPTLGDASIKEVDDGESNEKDEAEVEEEVDEGDSNPDSIAIATPAPIRITDRVTPAITARQLFAPRSKDENSSSDDEEKGITTNTKLPANATARPMSGKAVPAPELPIRAKLFGASSGTSPGQGPLLTPVKEYVEMNELEDQVGGGEGEGQAKKKKKKKNKKKKNKGKQVAAGEKKEDIEKEEDEEGEKQEVDKEEEEKEEVEKVIGLGIAVSEDSKATPQPEPEVELEAGDTSSNNTGTGTLEVVTENLDSSASQPIHPGPESMTTETALELDEDKSEVPILPKDTERDSKNLTPKHKKGKQERNAQLKVRRSKKANAKILARETSPRVVFQPEQSKETDKGPESTDTSSPRQTTVHPAIAEKTSNLGSPASIATSNLEITPGGSVEEIEAAEVLTSMHDGPQPPLGSSSPEITITKVMDTERVDKAVSELPDVSEQPTKEEAKAAITVETPNETPLEDDLITPANGTTPQFPKHAYPTQSPARRVPSANIRSPLFHSTVASPEEKVTTNKDAGDNAEVEADQVIPDTTDSNALVPTRPNTPALGSSECTIEKGGGEGKESVVVSEESIKPQTATFDDEKGETAALMPCPVVNDDPRTLQNVKMNRAYTLHMSVKAAPLPNQNDKPRLAGIGPAPTPIESTSAEAYKQGTVKVFTAETFGDFFGCYKALRRQIAEQVGRGEYGYGNEQGLGLYHYKTDKTASFFVEGVDPMWEDKQCGHGGKIVITGSSVSVSSIPSDPKSMVIIKLPNTRVISTNSSDRPEFLQPHRHARGWSL